MPSTTINGTSLEQRAKELFNGHERVQHAKTDRVLAGLMLAQWLIGLFVALVVSPRVWAGSQSQVHIHVWMALFLGGALAAGPVALAIWLPGQMVTRQVIGIAQAFLGALFIHLSGGRIETHFHVFVSLAILSFYRDWRVLIPATGVVALDHAIRGVWFPESVYGVLTASPWRWVEHAGWVIAEDVFLIAACVRGKRAMWAMQRAARN